MISIRDLIEKTTSQSEQQRDKPLTDARRRI